MKCPKCEKAVEQLFYTVIGTMCRDCCFTAAEAKPGEFGPLPKQPMTQMELLREVGAPRQDYFFAPGRGSITCVIYQASDEEMQFHSKTLPTRMMKSFFMKQARACKSLAQIELLHCDSFSCS